MIINSTVIKNNTGQSYRNRILRIIHNRIRNFNGKINHTQNIYVFYLLKIFI